MSQLSSVVQITQFSSGHSGMKGLFMDIKMWEEVFDARWWQRSRRVKNETFKLTERDKYVWNEHFTACLNNIYSMCCTCKWESGAQIWYKGLLENMTLNIQLYFFFHSAVLFKYLVLLLINVKEEKTPVVTQTTKLCNIWMLDAWAESECVLVWLLNCRLVNSSSSCLYALLAVTWT